MNKAIITIEEVERPDGHFIEKMDVNYELDKDEEGNVILRSNVIGMSRIIFELFRFGILERFSRVFVPSPDIQEQLDVLKNEITE